MAGTDYDNVIPILQSHLNAVGLGMVKVTPPPDCNDGVFKATRTEPDHPWAVFVRESVQRSAGSRPAIIPSMGGSICNDLFTDDLGLPAIWLPHSYASCSQHAPDEHVLVSVCRSALEVMTGLYWDIGSEETPVRPA